MSQRRKAKAASRREEARREAERLLRQARRRRGLAVLGVVLLVVGLAVAGVIIWQGAQATYLDDVSRRPQGSDTSGGIPVSADGVPGTAPDAPRLDVYLDVQSPASVAFWTAQAEDLERLRADGTVALWLHLVGFVDGGINGFSTRAGEAAVVVADRSPEQFLAFLDGAFARRAAGAEKLNDPDLAELGLEVGVSQDVVDKFTDGLFDRWFVAATQQAERDGVEDTPTIRLDGRTLEADWAAEGALAEAVGTAVAG